MCLHGNDIVWDRVEMRPVLSARVVILRVSFVAYSDFYLCITDNFSEDVKCTHSLRNYDCLSHSGGAGAYSPSESRSARSWNPMIAIACSLFFGKER